DPRDIDGQAGAIPGSLSVVALHLAPKVAQNQRSWRNDQEADEAQAVSESSAQHSARYEMKQRQHDHLLVMSGAAPRGEAHYLQSGGELHSQGKQRPSGEEASELNQQERYRRGDR